LENSGHKTGHVYKRPERVIDTRDTLKQIYWLEKLKELGDATAVLRVAGRHLFLTQGEAGVEAAIQ